MLRMQVRKKSDVLPIPAVFPTIRGSSSIPELNESMLAEPAAGASRVPGLHHLQDAGEPATSSTAFKGSQCHLLFRGLQLVKGL